jgi:hypothetical protein
VGIDTISTQSRALTTSSSRTDDRANTFGPALGARPANEERRMRARSRTAIAVLAAAMLFACGGDDDDVTCEELAAIIGDCGGEASEQDVLDGLCSTFVLSSDCLSEAADADCAEHDADVPSYDETCFPACAAEDNECLDDETIRLCAEGTEFIVFCAAICEETGATYTGTCADTFEDMQSESGQEVCWCE